MQMLMLMTQTVQPVLTLGLPLELAAGQRSREALPSAPLTLLPSQWQKVQQLLSWQAVSPQAL